MRILSMHSGHDGAIAYIEDGALRFSIEAEKDSFPRYSQIRAHVVIEALNAVDGFPDVVAMGGWHRGGRQRAEGAGYMGLDPPQVHEGNLFGRRVRYFHSTHERSHVYMSTGMAPNAPLEECAILTWEGLIGSFYHWRRGGAELEPLPVLEQPGQRYAALFSLADPSFPDRGVAPDHTQAGKLMALAGYADLSVPVPREVVRVVDWLVEVPRADPLDKAALRDSPLYNAGVNTPHVHRAAAHLSDRLFEVYLEAARAQLPAGLPLVISGGCGLNCEWNRRWEECGHFSDVFVPPCTNDTGSAIGTALDAQVTFGGPQRLDWSVYAGPEFIDDMEPDASKWERVPLDYDALAEAITDGAVVAWVQGRAEIGPRALGHRSLLASPLRAETKDLLNEIKQREDYRPIAPACLLEELPRWFEDAREDPYMLFFANVRTDALPAVTHVDRTARVQSVGPDGDPRYRALLEAQSRRTGYGVLCNTSLNYKGRGFINRSADLFFYCQRERIDHVVVDDVWYRRHRTQKGFQTRTATARAG
jgi:hydroxymethyl cephem carbamoyltransferase